jgi:uridine kinase
LTTRDEVLSRLVDAITAPDAFEVTRVGIDGRSAAGKTTMAEELAMRLRARRRTCLRASIDDFHPPGHAQRSASGGYTVESYYAEGFDYAAFRRELLGPAMSLDPRGVRLRAWDSFHDRPYEGGLERVAPGDILVVDGAFLFRPELRDCWSFTIWLDIDFETMVARARTRDIAWMPSVDAIERRYRERWIPLHTLYEAETGAPGLADAVIDNTDPAHPRISRLGRD